MTVLFPVALLGAMAAERLALLSLGANPDSPLAWRLWLGLHEVFGRFWQQAGIAGTSVSFQLLALSAIAGIVLVATSLRRWTSYSILGNHAALLIAFGISMLGGHANVSSLGPEAPEPGLLALSLVSQLPASQVVILTVGVLSCILCHAAFWSEARRRSAAVSLRIRELQKSP